MGIQTSETQKQVSEHLYNLRWVKMTFYFLREILYLFAVLDPAERVVFLLNVLFVCVREREKKHILLPPKM